MIDSKNLRLQMGRCPVRQVFAESLSLLEKKQDLLGYVSNTRNPPMIEVAGFLQKIKDDC